uniref:Uncharacterized protein n=1 Tax=Meloidogyne enterolobii TaxID=390850 RepID=A0A6V7Y944_MELEN|nr:unnamed protein product [Meloidogyne enterolobii]
MLTDYKKIELLEIIDKGKKKQKECQLSDSSNASSSTTSQVNIPIKNVETEEIENIKKENKIN